MNLVDSSEPNKAKVLIPFEGTVSIHAAKKKDSEETKTELGSFSCSDKIVFKIWIVCFVAGQSVCVHLSTLTSEVLLKQAKLARWASHYLFMFPPLATPPLILQQSFMVYSQVL